MKKNSEIIHIHTSSNKINYYILFLLIPSIVFVTTLAFYFRLMPKRQAANTGAPPIVQNQKAKTSVLIGNTEILVSVANTEIERKKGLSGTTSLPENHGLLLVFDSQDIKPPFWMKDMVIPIDIIWINDSKVVQIHKNVEVPLPNTPESALKLYIPDEPIDYVLEVNAGFSDRNNINVGDSVIIKL